MSLKQDIHALFSPSTLTLYPIALLIFRLGISAKVAFGVMQGILPVAIFIMDAVRNINLIWLKAARVLKLWPTAIERGVQHHNATSHLFRGFHDFEVFAGPGHFLRTQFASSVATATSPSVT